MFANCYRLLGAAFSGPQPQAPVTIAAARLPRSALRTLNPADESGRSPQIRPGTNTSFASLKRIDAGVLNVGMPKPVQRWPAVILAAWLAHDIHASLTSLVAASAGYQ